MFDKGALLAPFFCSDRFPLVMTDLLQIAIDRGILLDPWNPERGDWHFPPAHKPYFSKQLGANQQLTIIAGCSNYGSLQGTRFAIEYSRNRE